MFDMTTNWTQHVVLVTGANRGIGEALVEALLAQGVKKIYATARQQTSLSRWTDTPQVVTLALDIRKPEACQRAAASASDVTLLINNAGTLASYDLLTAEHEALNTDFATNFYGLLNMARAFTPILTQAQDAHMVNLLTLVSVASMPAIGGYSASKAAAWSLTMALCAQLKPQGIQVHGVYPGAVDTDMIRHFDMPKTSPSHVAQAILDGIARGDEDIAPDPMSAQLWSLFLNNPKAVEQQFANM